MKQVVEMTLFKEMKGSVRYKEKGEPAGHILQTVYVKKSAFDGEYPKEIQVTVESQTEA